MNIARPFICLSLLATWMLSGCALLQSKQIKVKKTPADSHYTTLNNYTLLNGYPYQRDWWIAFSDRELNTTCISPTNNMPLKKMGFMDAAYIVEENAQYVKLLQYSADIDLANNKGRLPRKTAKTTGWIKKDKLLLWQVALPDNSSRFTAKAIIHLSGRDILANANRYVLGDSMILFSSPSLQTPNGIHIAPGSLVYLYKQSEDKKSFLIGKEPSITVETAKQNMLGWINKDAISIWGTNSAFSFNPEALTADSTGLLYANQDVALSQKGKPLFTSSEIPGRTFFENIHPVQNRPLLGDSTIQTGYLENIMDYSKNSVYNVLGNPITYHQYLQIMKNFRQINVVFVLDASVNNRMYFPLAKSIIQDLQMYFDTATQVKNYRFGAVTYKYNKCRLDTFQNVFGLTHNFTDVEYYLDQKLNLATCSDENIYQPLYRGLSDACNLLMPYKNETNMIIVIGTTGNGNIEDRFTMGNTINKLTQVRARLLMFQSLSKRNDAYNDFVLDAEKLVTSSAANIAELKKEMLVDINDVIYNPSYSMRTGDSGIYTMDYPRKSMTQGMVLFPKKGEIMPAGVLKNYFDTLLMQVASDNNITGTKLKEYFYTIGVKSTSLKPAFASYASNLQLSTGFTRAFAGAKNNYFIPAYTLPVNNDRNTPFLLNYGVLLSETEYDKLMDQFYTIYSITAASENFNAKKACRRYKTYVQEYVKVNKITPPFNIKRMTLAQNLYLYTGFISADSLFNTTPLRKLKKRNPETVLRVFNSFKYAADAMQDNKNSSNVKFNNNNIFYYYLNQQQMPQGVYQKEETE
ncbi:hypothetical protein SAMN05421788_105179 [Filimonas lacunae]|uniref:VWFA domain-containing protein n=1 Tax=Filimonas lacunae TaxID=477680 RepID=A0A173MCX7_9BACT|nr:type VI secretion system protein TssR domain-containing protein [Filimonas lacunae]BAV05366.1 hypothetical protein FLA_1373 [Filimonas lacunae]SIT21703.1 hypothetical protein SAMN05421788_105179 [Filimonas lacunae]